MLFVQSKKKMKNVFCLIYVLIISVASAASECSKYDFPCEDGGCVDSGLWCDSSKDCSDGSDEKYCQFSTWRNSDPNKCPLAYFKCKNGRCIPSVGRCDGYENCEDKSDEKGCENIDKTSDGVDTSPNAKSEAQIIATTSKSTKHTTTTPRPKAKFEESLTTDDFKENWHSGELVFFDSDSLDYSRQLKDARNWLLQQRKSDFGWGDETPRAITALYLSGGQHSIMRNESDFLMVKQLEVQLALNLARNGTRLMKLSNLALYINALMASCKDPKNFYGDDLVRSLRNSVDAAIRGGTFVNPCVYLTLCMNNASAYEDVRKLQEIQFNRNVGINRMDVQALALLTSACHHRNTNYLPATAYDGLKKQFLHRLNASTRPGNVYETALLMQALHELKVTQPGLLPSILQKQQDDGSFGGILATYLVLPVLAGKSFLQINEHCSHQYSTDPAPIEVLKNMKRRKIPVKYSLRIGYPVETTETIEMQVAEGVSFLDVMRLAQEINSKFRFMLDGNREIPVVYSIGGIPNDAEKGLFWTLYLASIRNRATSEGERLVPNPGNIKTLIPHHGDEYIFWMRSI